MKVNNVFMLKLQFKSIVYVIDESIVVNDKHRYLIIGLYTYICV